MNKKEGKMILCERALIIARIQQVYEEEKGEVNTLAYMGKWRALVGVGLKPLAEGTK